MRVGQFYLGAYFGHFRVINGAVFVHPVVDERAAFGQTDYGHEIRQIVGIDAHGVYIRVDFLGQSMQVTVVLVNGQVNQVRLAVERLVAFTSFVR